MQYRSHPASQVRTHTQTTLTLQNPTQPHPRISDGFAGGHLITQNLLFNSVRETNDHGAINTWDRQPYAWRPWDPSNVNPLPMLETRNFIINNYNGVWGLCHDDGSNGYTDTFNFLPWSGTKNYLGFNKTSVGNYFLYADYSPQRLAAARRGELEEGYGNGWNACSMSYGTAALPANLTDVWESNTCICASSGRFFDCESPRNKPAIPPPPVSPPLTPRATLPFPLPPRSQRLQWRRPARRQRAALQEQRLRERRQQLRHALRQAVLDADAGAGARRRRRQRTRARAFYGRDHRCCARPAAVLSIAEGVG